MNENEKKIFFFFIDKEPYILDYFYSCIGFIESIIHKSNYLNFFQKLYY